MVVVGLGNPGPDYAHTRHNVGFRCLDHFAQAHLIKWTGRRGPLVWGEGKISASDGDKEIILAKPRTFMNLSGEAVRYVVDRWHVGAENLLVVYDDVDLPLGTIRIRPRGSAGGHKGMRSIIEALGSEEVPRIRVGIGREEGKEVDTVDYVLSEFTEKEQQVLEGVFATVSEAILCVLAEGTASAMNRYN